MRYIKEILKKNRIWVLVYIGLGIFNAFMANYKADYFQKVIDGLLIEHLHLQELQHMALFCW